MTKGQAGVKWYGVVKEVWNDVGGNQQEKMSTGKCGGYKTKVKIRDKI